MREKKSAGTPNSNGFNLFILLLHQGVIMPRATHNWVNIMRRVTRILSILPGITISCLHLSSSVSMHALGGSCIRCTWPAGGLIHAVKDGFLIEPQFHALDRSRSRVSIEGQPRAFHMSFNQVPQPGSTKWHQLVREQCPIFSFTICWEKASIYGLDITSTKNIPEHVAHNSAYFSPVFVDHCSMPLTKDFPLNSIACSYFQFFPSPDSHEQGLLVSFPHIRDLGFLGSKTVSVPFSP